MPAGGLSRHPLYVAIGQPTTGQGAASTAPAATCSICSCRRRFAHRRSQGRQPSVKDWDRGQRSWRGTPATMATSEPSAKSQARREQPNPSLYASRCSSRSAPQRDEQTAPKHWLKHTTSSDAQPAAMSGRIRNITCRWLDITANEMTSTAKQPASDSRR